MLNDPARQPAPRMNRLLDRISDAEFARVLPHLQYVDLEFGKLVCEAGGMFTYAYFPAGGVLSAIRLMQDGNAIEVGTVGFEGVVGFSPSGNAISPNRIIAQLAGPAFRMPQAAIHAAGGELLRVLLAYHEAFLAQVSQSVACNGLHRIEQRCCRWLLMSRDRIQSDDLRLTHEYLAIMLGARRPSVTEVLKPLQAAGLVRSRRGRITILDGPGLEARACECYAIVKDEYERLLGVPE